MMFEFKSSAAGDDVLRVIGKEPVALPAARISERTLDAARDVMRFHAKRHGRRSLEGQAR